MSATKEQIAEAKAWLAKEAQLFGQKDPSFGEGHIAEMCSTILAALEAAEKERDGLEKALSAQHEGTDCLWNERTAWKERAETAEKELAEYKRKAIRDACPSYMGMKAAEARVKELEAELTTPMLASVNRLADALADERTRSAASEAILSRIVEHYTIAIPKKCLGTTGAPCDLCQDIIDAKSLLRLQPIDTDTSCDPSSAIAQ